MDNPSPRRRLKVATPPSWTWFTGARNTLCPDEYDDTGKVVRYVAGAVVMRVQEVRDWESEKYGPGRSLECVLVGGHLDGEPVEYMLRSQLKRDLETNMADGTVRLGNVYAFRREADKGRAMVIAMYPATQTDEEDFQELGPSEGSEVLTECTTHHTAWTGKSSKTGVRFHLVTLPSGQDAYCTGDTALDQDGKVQSIGTRWRNRRRRSKKMARWGFKWILATPSEIGYSFLKGARL